MPKEARECATCTACYIDLQSLSFCWGIIVICPHGFPIPLRSEMATDSSSDNGNATAPLFLHNRKPDWCQNMFAQDIINCLPSTKKCRASQAPFVENVLAFTLERGENEMPLICFVGRCVLLFVHWQMRAERMFGFSSAQRACGHWIGLRCPFCSHDKWLRWNKWLLFSHTLCAWFCCACCCAAYECAPSVVCIFRN